MLLHQNPQVLVNRDITHSTKHTGILDYLSTLPLTGTQHILLAAPSSKFPNIPAEIESNPHKYPDNNVAPLCLHYASTPRACFVPRLQVPLRSDPYPPLLQVPLLRDSHPASESAGGSLHDWPKNRHDHCDQLSNHHYTTTSDININITKAFAIFH